mmetsp:Transcript_17972/g.20403  ORF Transcript_17972/g.20403 Transcript_17972/m.20403 type:complete len:84 (+) Transcript_17972:848-1099(+)
MALAAATLLLVSKQDGAFVEVCFWANSGEQKSEMTLVCFLCDEVVVEGFLVDDDEQERSRCLLVCLRAGEVVESVKTWNGDGA